MDRFLLLSAISNQPSLASASLFLPSIFIKLLNKLLNRGNRNIKFDFSLKECSKNKKYIY